MSICEPNGADTSVTRPDTHERQRPVAASQLCHCTDGCQRGEKDTPAGRGLKPTDSASRGQHPGLIQATTDGRQWKKIRRTDSQDIGPASDFSLGQPVEPPVTMPAALAVIPIEALLAITQALKLSSAGS